MNNDKKFTRLILEQQNLHVEWEIPYDDPTGEDMMQAIRTIMIGMTFNDNTIEDSMASYLIDHSDNYTVYNNYEDESDDSDEQVENTKINGDKLHFYN